MSRPIYSSKYHVACDTCLTGYAFLPVCGGPCCNAHVCPNCAGESGWCPACCTEQQHLAAAEAREEAEDSLVLLAVLIGGWV